MKAGLFWDQAPVAQSKPKLRPMPPIPDTGWQRPTHYPDLSAAKCIAIDVETYDPDLLEFGPGWARGVGHIVGVSIGTDDGYRAYFPIRHEIEPEWNLPPETVLRWLNDVLSNPNQAKVGANITYDIGWLMHEGVNVQGLPMDVQYAEALLDESAKVALEVLGQKYCQEGKVSDVLYQWCSDFYGGPVSGEQRANIYRTPPRLTGYYAESDVDLPIKVFEEQYAMLVSEGLWDVFMMECELIYLMIAMRFRGVTVDIPKAEQINEELKIEVYNKQQQLNYLAGFEVNTLAGASLAKLFDQEGIKYPYTAPSDSYPNGQPSFTGKFMDTINHPAVKLIQEIKKSEKFNSNFIEACVLESNVNGKLYGTFHQLRGDGKGTRSGRFSATQPPLQTIPSRDKIWGPKIRGLFIPDAGDIAWRKYDYSQIEYRFLLHFAVGQGSEEVRAHFNRHPETDYHERALDLVGPAAGWDVSDPSVRKHKRKPIKNINFGFIYGMGVNTLSENLGLSPQEGNLLFEAYHAGVPFAKDTMDKYSDIAKKTGIVTTIMGRRSRFDRWQQSGKRGGDESALDYYAAIRKYGTNIERAYTHKALNRVLQGSAADQMKKAMWQCWKDGVFSETGVPSLTVHDELNYSDPGGKDEAFKEMANIMETCLPLSIPVKVDGEIGPDWGHVKDIV